MSNEFTTIQQDFKQWLSTVERNENNEMNEGDRFEALKSLTKLLNASGVSIPEHEVEAGKFVNDGEMRIECGERDQYGNRKWEIVLWLDGCVQSTTYDLNLGGLYDYYAGHNLFNVIDNPQLVVDDLNKLIERYNEIVDEMIENGDYDFDANN